MEPGNSKQTYLYLFLLTAVAGIAMFVSAWNSFILGKEKIYISLSFLILFLFGLLALYFKFNRLYSLNKEEKSSDSQQSVEEMTEPKTAKNEMNSGLEDSFGLLKGVFNNPDVKSIGEKLLKNLAREFEIVQGVFFVLNPETLKFTPAASYALSFDNLPNDFISGEGISGQAVEDNKIIIIPNLPESFSPVISGLGNAKARFLYIIPLIHEKKSFGVIEISCFKEIEESRIPILHQLMREGGLKLNSVLSAATR